MRLAAVLLAAALVGCAWLCGPKAKPSPGPKCKQDKFGEYDCVYPEE